MANEDASDMAGAGVVEIGPDTASGMRLSQTRRGAVGWHRAASCTTRGKGVGYVVAGNVVGMA